MVMCNSIFNYFPSNKLFISSHSGLLPGDSCTAQLLSIVHEIQTAFGNPTADMSDVFLDISEEFDWKSCFQIKICWCWRWIIVSIRKLSWKSWIKDSFKWSNLLTETNLFWSSSRIGVWSAFTSNLHKRLTWWNNINM